MSSAFNSHAIRIITTLYLLVVALTAIAEPPRVSSEPKVSFSLNHQLYWLEDPTQTVTVQELIERDPLLAFRRNTQSSGVNLGKRSGTIWIYLPIRIADLYRQSLAESAAATLPTDLNWYLNIDSLTLNAADIFIQRKNGTVTTQYLDDIQLMKARGVYLPGLSGKLAIDPEQEVGLFVKIKSKKPIQFSLQLLSEQQLQRQELSKLTFYTIAFSIGVIMFIYSFFAYRTLNNPVYLNYLFFIFSMGALNLSITGHSYAHFWQNFPLIAKLDTNVLLPIFAFLGLQLTRRFLSSKIHDTLADRAIQYTSYLSLFVLVVTVAFDEVAYTGYAGFIYFISSLIIITASIRSYRRGYNSSRFFILAWLFLLTAGVADFLVDLDLIATTFYTLNTFTIGTSLSVIFLSLALEDQISNRLKNNIRNEQQIREQLQLANQELNATTSKLAEINRVKDQFLATISHELRTPMNGVEGSLDLINTKNLNQQQLDYIHLAKSSAKEMTSLIDSILRFSEIQSGQVGIKQELFEIRPMLNAAAIGFSHQCQRKKLDFNWHVSKDVPMLLLGDADNIVLIFKNLIDNAIKFTNQGRVTVDISIKDDDDNAPQLQFIVADTGEGIPTKQLNKIFEAFHQLDGNFNRRHKGLGIGLTMCYQLANLMGGKLDVHSEPQVGTTITALLPVAHSSEQQDLNTDQTNKQHRQKTVLIAEDNPVNQMVIKGMLQELGCFILTAENGAEVLDILEEQPVDLIMMDCQMPNIDGFEATEKIRKSDKSYSDIPIIAVTANAMTGDSMRCLIAGMNDYIKKPINRETLQHKVERWLKDNMESAA